MSQAKPPFKAPPPPPPCKLRRRIFHVVKGNGELQAPRQLARLLAGWRGEVGVICRSMPFDNGSSDWAQIQHEDGVLLHLYLNKICLTLTGDFWRALASLYSESEAIKGS